MKYVRWALDAIAIGGCILHGAAEGNWWFLFLAAFLSIGAFR